jgi:arsenate reductase
MNMKKKVLFLCTHNSARSQMAEGLLRALHGDRFEVHSAGTHPTSVHPAAVKVMREIGIDITPHESKGVERFQNTAFDYVVTVCDLAREACPFRPGAGAVMHRSFTDPSSVSGDNDEVLAAFARVRDEIKKWLAEKFIREISTL